MGRHSHPLIGLIVNPIAGMGGSVGLKGTDGALADKARQLGAEPQASDRAARALEALKAMPDGLEIATVAGEMGEAACRAAGLTPASVLGDIAAPTTPDDTTRAAHWLAERAVDLLLFCGGDGTARLLLETVGEQSPVLGIPAGVKMHSAVFAATPKSAGDVARLFLTAGCPEELLQPREVLDRESGPGADHAISPRLYGSLTVPAVETLVQRAKAASPQSAAAELEGACRRLAALTEDERVSIIGPGTTLQRVKGLIGFEGTLLGVDVVSRGACIARDCSEKQLLELIDGRAARIIVSVVGGQGFVFGRGNQQISARVIEAVGVDNIVIVASLEKLAGLGEAGLLVDTGDAALDEKLTGFVPVLTGRRKTAMVHMGPAVPPEHRHDAQFAGRAC